MQFSEDDLKAALKRKDPGPDFTQRVMARLSEADTRKAGGAQQPGLFAWLTSFRFAPALATGLVALMLLVGAWIGYQSYHEHQRVARQIELQRQAEAKKAEQEAILALRISSEKLNHVFRKVNGSLPQEDKIRRQRL
jgi:hypothetical protein